MEYSDKSIHSYEKRLFEYNKSLFGNYEFANSEESVLVLHSLPTELNFCALEDIAALKISGHKNRVLSIQFEAYRKSVEELDKTYGIMPFFIKWNDFDETEYKDIAFRFVDKLKNSKDKEVFLSMKYKDIEYGEILYGDSIRKKFISVEDAGILLEKEFIELHIKILHTIDLAYDFFSKHKCSAVVISEWGYTNGLFARIAQEFGACIYIVDIMRPNYISRIYPNKKMFETVKVADVIKCKGNYDIDVLDESRDLFVLKRKDFNASLNINENGKANVFILPHAFTDNPRTGDHMDVFIDYYDWFIYTLETIKDIKDINWYIKDHPESRAYGQGKVTKKLCDKYSSDNIIWCDKKFSGSQIASVADCVVTCAGDAGIEFWVQGIPTITAANAYYTDWGISYRAKSVEEYKRLLQEAGKLKKPTNESSKMAREKLLKSSLFKKKGYAVLDIFYETRIEQLRAFRADGYHNENYVFYKFVDRLNEVNSVQEYDVIASDVISL